MRQMRQLLRFTTILLIFTCCLYSQSGVAQDFSYSQFYNASFTYNPALTGHLPSSYRLVSMYRQQWRNIDKGFRNYSLVADGNLYSPSHNTFGYGILIDQEESGGTIDGSARLKTTHALASIAAHINIGKGEKYFVSFGFQGGAISRRYNTNNLKFASGLLGGINEVVTVPNATYLDLRAGVNWTSYLSNRFTFKMGASYFHLGGINEAIINETFVSTIPATLIVHGDAEYKLNKEGSRMIQPSFIIFSQGGARQFNFGMTYYQYVGTQQIFAGVHWRVMDAIVANFGFEYNNIRFAFSYDVNHSSLARVTNGRGGYEISLGYLGQIARSRKTENPYERGYF